MPNKKREVLSRANCGHFPPYGFGVIDFVCLLIIMLLVVFCIVTKNIYANF